MNIVAGTNTRAATSQSSTLSSTTPIYMLIQSFDAGVCWKTTAYMCQLHFLETINLQCMPC